MKKFYFWIFSFIFFTLIFTIVTLYSRSEPFALERKIYSNEFELLQNSLHQEVDTLEKSIYTDFLATSYNLKILQGIATEKVQSNQISFSKSKQLVNFIITDNQQRVIYQIHPLDPILWENFEFSKKRFITKDTMFFQIPFETTLQKISLFFEFDSKYLLRQAFSHLEKYNEYAVLQFPQLFILDMGRGPHLNPDVRTQKEEVLKAYLPKCQNPKQICNLYIPELQKRLLVDKNNYLNFSVGFLYDSNPLDISSISILIFIILFFFIVLLISIALLRSRRAKPKLTVDSDSQNPPWEDDLSGWREYLAFDDKPVSDSGSLDPSPDKSANWKKYVTSNDNKSDPHSTTNIEDDIKVDPEEIPEITEAAQPQEPQTPSDEETPVDSIDSIDSTPPVEPDSQDTLQDSQEQSDITPEITEAIQPQEPQTPSDEETPVDSIDSTPPVKPDNQDALQDSQEQNEVIPEIAEATEPQEPQTPSDEETPVDSIDSAPPVEPDNQDTLQDSQEQNEVIPEIAEATEPQEPQTPSDEEAPVDSIDSIDSAPPVEPDNQDALQDSQEQNEVIPEISEEIYSQASQVPSNEEISELHQEINQGELGQKTDSPPSRFNSAIKKEYHDFSLELVKVFLSQQKVEEAKKLLKEFPHANSLLLLKLEDDSYVYEQSLFSDKKTIDKCNIHKDHYIVTSYLKHKKGVLIHKNEDSLPIIEDWFSPNTLKKIDSVFVFLLHYHEEEYIFMIY